MTQSTKWISAKPDEPVVVVAQRTLSDRLIRINHLLPLAARKWEQDVEYVHQLRVSSRRVQTALAIYGALLPKRRLAWMNKQMKRIRRASNNARDDDVFILRLEQDEKNQGAAKLAKRVRLHREDSQQAILEIFDRLKKKKRLERRSRKLVQCTRLRSQTDRANDPCFSDRARTEFTVILDEFLRAASCDHSDLEALHEMRITGKKVRYAIEILSGAFSKSFRRETYAAMAKMQDKLGDINDHFSAIKRIEFWIDEAASANKSESRYLQDILCQEQQLLLKSRRDFCKWWSRKRASRLRKIFRAAMCD